jgi:hypothetical protein
MRLMNMKHYALFIPILILSSGLSSQNKYVPLNKARHTTDFIFISTARQADQLKKKILRYPECTGIKIDTRNMSKIQISDFIHFLSAWKNINELWIRYDHNDSIDFNGLSTMKHLQSLCLQNAELDYTPVAILGSLPDLTSLSLYVNQIDQVPVCIGKSNALEEINLLTETYQETLATDLYFYYKLNDTLYNYIEMNSYIDWIDLASDSIKRVVFAIWPGAEEKKLAYTGLNGNNSTRVLAKPDPFIYYKSNPNFKPLILQGNKNNFEKSLINPLVGNTLVFKDGTTLSIPEAAFVTKSGKPVEGDVNILYRTVRTPADMLASGITMFYDTAGQTEMFKTNGMFEIRAFAGSEELSLKSGKQLTIDFESNRNTGNFNLYTLNDSSGKWQFNNSIANPSGNLTNGVTNQSFVWRGSYATMKDKTEFSDRYDDLSYTYLLPKGSQTGSIKVPTLNSDRKRYLHEQLFVISSGKSNSIKPGKTLVKLRVVSHQSNNRQGKVSFTLYSGIYNQANEYVEPFFPELKPFEDFVFEFDGSLKTFDFSKLYKKGKCYNDIRIYYENDAEQAIIELKTKDGFIEIPVKATYITSKGRVKPNPAFKRAYRRYMRLLAMKETKFNRTVYRTVPDWFVSDTSVYDIVIVKKKGDAIYKLNVNMLGIFNCDQIYRIKEPTTLTQPQFVCNDSVLNDLYTIYVIDNDAQGTYTFSPSLITISHKNTGGLVIHSNTGQVYTCTAEDFRSQVPASKDQIKGQVIKVEKMQVVKTADEVVAGLNN